MASNASLFQVLLLLVAALMVILYGNSSVLMLAVAAPPTTEIATPTPPPTGISEIVDGQNVPSLTHLNVEEEDDERYDVDDDASQSDDDTSESDDDDGEHDIDNHDNNNNEQEVFDCETVNPFPAEVFDEQPDATKVYLKPALLPKCFLTDVGFERFITVFGIPIIATNAVSSEVLDHVGVMFAEFLDNNEDGMVDYPEALEVMREYRTIIGYVEGVEESNELWYSRINDPENFEFRKQFSCNMQFFEQWAKDSTPEMHKLLDGDDSEGDDAKFCQRRSELEFDWPLWYFPFITTYYGYLEMFDRETINLIENKKNKAQEAAVYMGLYPEDLDMELSDFFAWSLLTVLKGLRCHCAAGSHAWNICSLKDFEEFDKEWVEFLQNSEKLPHTLPNGKYVSSAGVVTIT